MTAAASTLPAPGSAAAWRLAARPATLGAAVVPVAVGTACAHVAGGVQVGPALAALFGAMAIQIGTNFANDVFDFEKGADTSSRLGPTRAVQAGLLTPPQMRRGMVMAFALAAVAGAYLTVVAGPVIVLIGAASIASGIAYTGGPYPLGYNGLGDIFVMGFFGFVAVLGTMFVQRGDVSALAVWLSIPVGALATAILVVNNLRDSATDALVGKRTLAVRFGRRSAIVEYALLVLAAYAIPVGIAVHAGAPTLLLPLASLPLALWLIRQVATRHGRELNPLLVLTGKLLIVHGALLSVGLWLAAR